MVLSSDQGTVVSVDGAKTWSTWYNQPTAQLYHVSADNRFPYWLYGAQQDSGGVGVRTFSREGVLSFRDWKPTCLAGESNTVSRLRSLIIFSNGRIKSASPEEYLGGILMRIAPRAIVTDRAR